METLYGLFGVDVSSVITDYLTLAEMRVYNIRITRDILARIVASVKDTPLTVTDYKSLMLREHGVNVIEADILLSIHPRYPNRYPPREFLEDVKLYSRFPQYINDLIVKRFLWEYTPEMLKRLSIIISRHPGGGVYRQARESQHYYSGQDIDQTFNETTLRRIIRRYLNNKVPLPWSLSNFLIETGHDQLIHEITQQSRELLVVGCVERAFAFNQDVVANYILGELLNEQIEIQRYDLLSNIRPTIFPLGKLVNALVGDPRFMSHLNAYISNIPLVNSYKDIFQALLNNSWIVKHTSRQFWLNMAAVSAEPGIKRLIRESLERM